MADLPHFDTALTSKLLGETARCRFSDVQRFFAQGVLLWVSEELDLIQVASVMAADDGDQFAQWQTTGKVALLPDATALSWAAENPLLWGVVVRPWVLVQAESIGNT